ncbi:MAG: extracellular solute-binding protein [Planctomycetes bacterium]|nr:extracellular solute-binding protein [Planctomycetota bacterium]
MRALTTVLFAAVLAGCGAKPTGSAVRIYVSLDQQFSAPLLDSFAKELGITLDQQHDTEAAKTVGHVSAIVEERANPRGSVFWNNELANTVHLANQGLLEPYDSPAAQDVPAMWRDPQHRWTAFAARARILVVNTELLPDPASWPTSYRDLVDPKWKGRCAVAKPLTGTTMTHFTAMRKQLGEQAFAAWIDGMFANDVQFLASNGATLRAVREGKLAFAFTDTDDYHEAAKKGFKVACVFPDQQDGGIGTMLIPNSVALIKGGPNQAAAKQLIDKILARETEALLAAADGAQIPLRAGVPGPKDPGIKAPGAFRAMQWDIDWTAANLAAMSRDYGKRFGL